jgi:SecD/SecF fusion protein
MQNKAVIRLFAIAFAVACLYELSFTFVAQRVESQAREFAQGNPIQEKAYLDSIASFPVYNLGITEFTYKEVKGREMNLGLDLRGGMNVILEVSVRDVLVGLSGNSKDPMFLDALAKTDARMADAQGAYLDLFFQEMDAVRGTRKLNDIGLFGTKDMADRAGSDASDDDIKNTVRGDVNAAISNVYTVLKARIDQFGVVQPNIQKLENSGRILVELPGVKDPARVQRLLQGTARLEFWRTYQGADWMQFMVDANDKLKAVIKESSPAAKAAEAVPSALDVASIPDAEGGKTAKGADTANKPKAAAADTANKDFGPLLKAMALNVNPQTGAIGEGPIIGYAATKDTAKINGYLRNEAVLAMIPGDKRYVRFAWTRPEKETDVTMLIALRGNRDNQPELDGEVIVDARQEFDNGNNPVVSMSMNGQGAQLWKRITGEEAAKTPKGHVAVVLDGLVYSYPRVMGEIAGGRTQIEGGFALEEATDLANVLRAGKLPVPARIIQSDVVGPSLGKEAIQASLWSFAYAMGVVFLYMLFYYAGAGWAANLSLVVNMFFIFGILDAIGAVLTLPGMAGIVLTIGMAVDANVLIYERIREELAGGKPLETAVNDGYKHSYGAILDSNLTTLLTAVILYLFGTGPIRGFATTLIIGILSSLFTAIFVSRLYIDWKLSRKSQVTFTNTFFKGLFINSQFGFMKVRKIAYAFSAILVIGSFISLATKGLQLGVDFSGGRTYQVRFDQPVQVEEVSASLLEVYRAQVPNATAPVVKTLGTSDQVVITSNFRIDEVGADVEEELQTALFDGVKGFYAKSISKSDFLSIEENPLGLVASRQVGPTVADDIQKTAIWAVLFSLLGIFIYLLVRFNKWQYSMGAVVAVMHDAIVVMGVFSVFNGILPFSLEVDQAFVAAILTVIGYSLNDTVVVYDRIREFFGEKNHAKLTKSQLLDNALNQTLGRTFNTSMTTLVVLIVIFFFGGEVIRGFVFAILVGILVGTYSSLFVATPILADTAKQLGDESPDA